jgi:hypothetical protein
MSYFSVIILSILISFSVRAENASEVKFATIPTQTTQTKINEAAIIQKKSNYNIQIDFTGQAYVESSDQYDASEQIYQFQHKYNRETKNHVFKSQIIFGGYAEKKFFFGAIPELYYQYKISEVSSDLKKQTSYQPQQSYALGRKIVTSSQLDQVFNLGLMNPELTQDFITYQQQGLTGFHQDIDAKMWGIQLGILPVYLPNQGPSVKELNGKIESSNRWVKKPPTQFAFNDSNKEIIYSVQYDEVSKLILTPGVLAQIRFGEMNNKLHSIVSFSKKPMNEPVLERETFADLDIVGKVNLVPNVIYDDLFTVDLRYQDRNFKSAVSYISDRPENKTARSFYSIQNLQPITGYSFFAEYELPHFKARSVTLGFAIADFFGGEIRDINADGSENIFTFTKQRMQYQKPLQLYVRSDLFSVSGMSSRGDLKWLYDREQKGSLLSAQIHIPAMRTLEAHLGFDILGTEQQQKEDYGFLQQFQANDRVYGGLEYVF